LISPSGEVNPERLRRHVLLIDDEEHVPAWWRDRGLRRGRQGQLAGRCAGDGEIDQPLGIVEGMSRDARVDEFGPQRACGVGCLDG
jgi:hypothetical protein